MFIDMKNYGFAKSLMIGFMLMVGASSVSAQNSDFFGVANHVGAGVGVGTEGIGVDVAVPVTKYLQARVGFNVMPNINILRPTCRALSMVPPITAIWM